MSYALRARIFGAQDLSSSEKLVMLELAHHYNDKTGQCDPSLDLQRFECSLSERGLINILERLQERGKIAITRGGGRANRSNYVLFPGEETLNGVQGLDEEGEAETLNDVQGIEQTNPEHTSGFTGQNTERRSGFSGINPEPRSDASYKRRIYSSSSSARAHAGDVPPSTNPPDTPPPEPTADILAQTLCEVCALMPDALGEKHRGQLAEVLAWLRSIHETDDDATRAVLERYGEDAWDKPKPPHLPQVKSDWKRMERIVQHQKQTQNAIDPNLHPSGPNGQQPPRRRQREPQNDFQRNAADRRAARAELATKYAPSSRSGAQSS